MRMGFQSDAKTLELFSQRLSLANVLQSNHLRICSRQDKIKQVIRHVGGGTRRLCRRISQTIPGNHSVRCVDTQGLAVASR